MTEWKKCPICKTDMEQTAGYIDGEGRSHGTAWKCPHCGHREDES